MEIGDKIYNFKLSNDDNEVITEKDLLGKYTVLFFFPKALTPGCTKECIAFSDEDNLRIELNTSFSVSENDNSESEIADKNILSDINIEVADINWVGISADKPETMKKFRNKYDLKVQLLSDMDKSLAKKMDALKSTGGINRSTFIFDNQGTLKYAWKKVKVANHAKEVSEKLREFIE